MRSHRGLLTICLAACTATWAAFAESVQRAVVAIGEFIAACVPAEPFQFRLASDPIQLQPAFAYADPHVIRHEAMSHARAATRGR